MSSWFTRMHSWAWKANYKINDQPVREQFTASYYYYYYCHYNKTRTKHKQGYCGEKIKLSWRHGIGTEVNDFVVLRQDFPRLSIRCATVIWICTLTSDLSPDL